VEVEGARTVPTDGVCNKQKMGGGLGGTRAALQASKLPQARVEMS
jgi:hypothetical protein